MQCVLPVLPTSLPCGTWVLSLVPVQKELVLGGGGQSGVHRKLGALPGSTSGLGRVWAPSPLATAWPPPGHLWPQLSGKASPCSSHLLTRWLIHIDFFGSHYRKKSFQNGDTDVLLQEPRDLGGLPGPGHPPGCLPLAQQRASGGDAGERSQQGLRCHLSAPWAPAVARPHLGPGGRQCLSGVSCFRAKVWVVGDKRRA